LWICGNTEYSVCDVACEARVSPSIILGLSLRELQYKLQRSQKIVKQTTGEEYLCVNCYVVEKRLIKQSGQNEVHLMIPPYRGITGQKCFDLAPHYPSWNRPKTEWAHFGLVRFGPVTLCRGRTLL